MGQNNLSLIQITTLPTQSTKFSDTSRINKISNLLRNNHQTKYIMVKLLKTKQNKNMEGRKEGNKKEGREEERKTSERWKR